MILRLLTDQALLALLITFVIGVVVGLACMVLVACWAPAGEEGNG